MNNKSLKHLRKYIYIYIDKFNKKIKVKIDSNKKPVIDTG